MLFLISSCAVSENDEENNNSSFAIKVMLGMAIATSIDALAAGIPLATDNQNIWINITAIGVITFLFSSNAPVYSNCVSEAVPREQFLPRSAIEA